MSFTKQGIYHLTLYIPLESEVNVKLFIEKCKETDRSASNRICEFITQELEALDTEGKDAKRICELCNKEFTVGAQASFASGRRLTCCEACLKNCYDKGLVRRILREYH